jgi:Sigma-54 interaction domain
MTDPFKTLGETRSTDPYRTYRVDDTRLARVARELSLVGTARLNVLLVGGAEMVRLALETQMPMLPTPVVSWSPGEPFVLPPVERTGTLILHEVRSLSLHDQLQLLEWLAGAVRQTQVISTTSAPLLPRVCARGFVDALYYRLNTVYIDFSGVEEVACVC